MRWSNHKFYYLFESKQLHFGNNNPACMNRGVSSLQKVYNKLQLELDILPSVDSDSVWFLINSSVKSMILKTFSCEEKSTQ